MPPSSKSLHTLQKGFSLVELLVVILLMAFLLAISVGGYTAMIQSTALTTSAAMIQDTLAEARQSAMAQNSAVEIRIYDLPPQPNSTPVYCAMQSHWIKADGTTPPVSNPLFLSTSVVIDENPAHSSLISANNQIATPDATDSRLNKQTRVFHFLPDGSTDLNPSTKWFITVRAANQSDPAHFPSNWACIQIDPTTGRAQIYRP